MHVAFISDTHANLHALKAVLLDIAKAGADTLVNLGDVVGYGAHPAECVDRPTHTRNLSQGVQPALFTRITNQR